MLAIFFPFSFLFGTGLYFILADFLKVPTLATTKAVIAVTRREKKQAKSLEAIIFDLAVKLSKYIKMGDYKKHKMTAVLKSADMSLSPEVYTAKAIVKAGLILSVVIPKKKREAIETELPRFVNTLTQKLKASREYFFMHLAIIGVEIFNAFGKLF